MNERSKKIVDKFSLTTSIGPGPADGCPFKATVTGVCFDGVTRPVEATANTEEEAMDNAVSYWYSQMAKPVDGIDN